MKRYLIIIAAAFFGGFLALGTYRLMENNKMGRSGFSSTPFPVRQASYAPVNGPDFVEAASRSVHAVVHIKTEYQQKTSLYDFFFRGFFDYNNGGRPYVATGSGVVISDDGYIVTNNHVVQDADYIEVTLNDKRSYEAKIIGNDPTTDIALIKISETSLPFLVFGNSDQVKVGEWVLAVGNPFNLTSTVTAGIVSAKARNINILGDNTSIESFIQTDAAVNPGNSGGALVNTSGDLIGINAAIASNTGSYTGYSFAIPSNLVKKVVEDLKEYGTTQRGYMGLTPVDITSEFARQNGISDIHGVYVYDVNENSAAREAGIKKGDIITKVNSINVNSVSELLEIVGQYRPGDRVNLTFSRNSSEKNVDMVLRNKNGLLGLVKKEEMDVISLLGADLTPLSKDEKRWLRLENGVKVSKLKDGLLSQQGIRENYIILAIDKTPIKDTEDIQKALTGKRGGVLIEGIYPNRMRAYYMIVLKE
ncbi:MAG: Do family serine endopeptidase [Bacteroidetes bacterium]|nr:Do family serine endopeptidase [Bacteroidota bacterium]